MVTKVKIAIVASTFNKAVTDNLVKYCVKELCDKGIKKNQISIFRVPGAYEIPFVAHEVALRRTHRLIIALGCIIKGQTSHDQHIASWVSPALGQISLKTRIPILFGVLTPNSEAQALKRSRPGPLNRGKEVALAAIQLLHLLSKPLR